MAHNPDWIGLFLNKDFWPKKFIHKQNIEEEKKAH